jgi:uncharacterized protein (TIGR02996 family)
VSAGDAALAALYREVFEHPDDDHVRLVLADALLAAGDPRGELILAQLRPEADHEQRAMRLVQRHGLTWLGALRGAVLPLAYERGFVASCRVVGGVRRLLAAPEWGTIHTVEGASTRMGFVPSPAMRALRRLTGISTNTLLALANDHGERMRALTVEVGHEPVLVEMLARYLPVNPVARLIVHGARTPDVAAALHAAAQRHPGLALEVRP